jgi:Tfp pilus assembly protein PilO
MADLEPTTTTEVAAVEPVHVILNRPRKVYSGMWGPAEIGVVAAGAMAFLFAIIVYFLFVIPDNNELANNRRKADSLEAEVVSARTKYGEITSSQDQVTKILTSVDNFETQYLPAVSNGQQALYQRLNGLIIGYGLVNTSGPDYQPLDIQEQNQNQQQGDDKGREKFRSLYPGVYVTMTVEGSYQNLRRFIRDIETGNEFVVISAIELAPSDTQGTKPPVQTAPVAKPNTKPATTAPGFIQQQPLIQQGPRQSGKMHGEVVALHMELAAYFRRPNFAPVTQQ